MFCVISITLYIDLEGGRGLSPGSYLMRVPSVPMWGSLPNPSQPFVCLNISPVTKRAASVPLSVDLNANVA